MNLPFELARPPIARIEHSTGCVALPLGVIYVGRGAGCFLRIDDPAVSRVHLALEVGEDVTVRDRGSRNGTLLNGKLLRGDVKLTDGDVIVIGSRSLKVHIEPADPDLHDEETPAIRSGTLQGVSAGPHINGGALFQLEHCCSLCGSEVSAEDYRCEVCGHTWRRARSNNNPTEPIEDVGTGGLVESEEGEDTLVAAFQASDAVDEFADRRVHTRYELEQVTATYCGDRELRCEAHNISCGGVFLASDRSDAPGTGCVITLEPPTLPPATFEGEVVRVLSEELGRPGMAIRFDRLRADQIRWLAHLLLQRMSSSERLDPEA